MANFTYNAHNDLVDAIRDEIRHDVRLTENERELRLTALNYLTITEEKAVECVALRALGQDWEAHARERDGIESSGKEDGVREAWNWLSSKPYPYYPDESVYIKAMHNERYEVRKRIKSATNAE